MMKKFHVSTLLYAMLMLVLTACAGRATTIASLPPPQDTPSPSPSPTESVTSPSYETKVFRPAFTVELPPGWIVAERDPRAAQIYQSCNTCAHEGEENGEITLDMALANSSPSEAVARLQMAKNIDPGPSEPAELGDLSGFKFIATRTGTGGVTAMFQDSGYRTEAAGSPVQVYVVTVSGQTVTIIIDPHESTGSAADTFAKTALDIAKTIRFTN